MSSITVGLAGADARRNAREKRQKLILAGASVVLVVVALIFVLPLLRGGSSETLTPIATVPAATATAAPSPSTAGVASDDPVVSVARLAALRKKSSRDPFKPLIGANPPASGSGSSSAGSNAASPSRQPVAPRAVGFTPRAATPGRPTSSAPAVVRPTAAVIWTNGRRQVVGRLQTFMVGDATFRLVSFSGQTMRIRVAGGVFSGGGATLTVRKGRTLTLANTATGVRYRLLFSRSTTAAPTTAPVERSAAPTTTSPATPGTTTGAGQGK
jgi:hypothetical protein